MSKPTDEAMRAAVSVRTDIMASVATAEEHDQVAAIIIDAETHLPELLAVVEAARDVNEHASDCEATDWRGVGHFGPCDCFLKTIVDALAALDEAKRRDT